MRQTSDSSPRASAAAGRTTKRLRTPCLAQQKSAPPVVCPIGHYEGQNRQVQGLPSGRKKDATRSRTRYPVGMICRMLRQSTVACTHSHRCATTPSPLLTRNRHSFRSYWHIRLSSQPHEPATSSQIDSVHVSEIMIDRDGPGRRVCKSATASSAPTNSPRKRKETTLRGAATSLQGYRLWLIDTPCFGRALDSRC